MSKKLKDLNDHNAQAISMEWLDEFEKIQVRLESIEIFTLDDWELVFFDNRSRARLLFEGDVRFKSVEFSNLQELLDLFRHDPVFRVLVD